MSEGEAVAAASPSASEERSSPSEAPTSARASVLGSIRERIRSSLMSGRFKSLVKWRQGMKLRTHRESSLATGSSPTISLKPTPTEVEGNNSTNEPNTSHTESPENKSGVPHVIETNLVSSSFAAGASTFSVADSMPSFPGDRSNEDREITTTNDAELTNPRSNVDDTNNTTENIDDEENPINDGDALTIPSAVIGVQIQAANRGAWILDIVPVLYIQTESISSWNDTTQSTVTDGSLASSSAGSEGSSETSAGGSGTSSSGIIEIVETMDGGQRFENDFARPYYDSSVKPRCGSGASEGVVSVNGVVGGMDCMPLRPGPFHYLISEQAKSLVALQELQNEVGALLEFRDLVIETFPNLRHKMAVTAAASAAAGASSASNGTASVLITSQGSHIPLPLSSQSPSSRRMGEWEPGKVRRRVAQSRENESSSSSLPRSRSNSHSGGNKHSATVQDSGFSTETSSKDSASTAIPRPQSPSGRPLLDEAEDELWNLLDVIHRKGVRLREEVESLQGRLESVAPEELDVPSDILEAVRKVTRRRHSGQQLADDEDEGGLDSRDEEHRLLLGDGEAGPAPERQVALLQREKLQLLDKVAELEAETISSRARAQELQSELAALSVLRSGLEDRLRAGLEAGEAGILAPGAQRMQPIEPTATTANHALQSPRGSGLNIRSKDSAFASVVAGGGAGKAQKSRFRTRTIEKSALACAAAVSRSIDDVHGAATIAATIAAQGSVSERRARLGALDSVLISPTRLPKLLRREDLDTRKIAAILRERSPLELQRHLITSTVHNQVLQKRLDQVEKSTETLSERLGKAHEENEDLRFQLAERSIELEGTRARVRVLERLQQRPTTENDADDESEPQTQHHLHLNGHQQQNGVETGSSSTDSSRDLQHGNHINSSDAPDPLKPSPRRRPSRIPLLGATKATAPKPPVSSNSTVGHRRNDSKESLKSLAGQKPGGQASISSNRFVGAKTGGRDSSRESLTKSSLVSRAGQSAAREPASRSLPRNNSSRDSLGKQGNSSLSRPRDSLESAGNSNSQSSTTSPGTPPRRPPAPARRSQSQAARPTSASVGSAVDAGPDTGKSMQSSNPPSSWFSSGASLYPDSLDSNSRAGCDDGEEEDETSSRTGSTRVEFIIGSPTRKRFQTPWAMPCYFDSIDTDAMLIHDDEEFASDEYEREALAECDSLECDDHLQSDS